MASVLRIVTGGHSAMSSPPGAVSEESLPLSAADDDSLPPSDGDEEQQPLKLDEDGLRDGGLRGSRASVLIGNAILQLPIWGKFCSSS